MSKINLSKEAKSLVLDCNVKSGVAAVWYYALKEHFELYGADRMMLEKQSTDRVYLDIFTEQILKSYNLKSKQVMKGLDIVWKESKSNFDYFLTCILTISKSLSIIEKNKLQK